jgi:hypothetical protein
MKTKALLMAESGFYVSNGTGCAVTIAPVADSTLHGTGHLWNIFVFL